MTLDLKPGVALLARALTDTAPQNRLHRALTLRIGERDATLTFGPARGGGGLAHAFAIGDQSAVLLLPPSALEWLLHPLPVPNDPAQRAMLLELALLDLLTAIEAEFGAAIPIPNAAPPIALGIDVATGTGPLHLTLRVTDALAEALADHLDRHAVQPAPPDAESLTVEVVLRLGQQFLTPDEIAALAPGDVVMLEPGPALLLTEGFAAAIGMEASGAVVQSDLLPLPAPQPRTETHVGFEAARARMTLADLNALAPGAPLGLAVFEGAGVDLVIDGRIAGRGHPVTLGTGAGIRILHISDAAKAP